MKHDSPAVRAGLPHSAVADEPGEVFGAVTLEIGRPVLAPPLYPHFAAGLPVLNRMPTSHHTLRMPLSRTPV